MQLLWTVFLVFGAADIFYTEAKGRSSVLQLTGANFANIVNDKQIVLVNFYADWCNFCIIFEPIYDKVAEDVRAQGIDVVVCRVDGNEEEELRREQKVYMYPLIRIYIYGRPVDFRGPYRDISAIIIWIKDATKPAKPEPPPRKYCRKQK